MWTSYLHLLVCISYFSLCLCWSLLVPAMGNVDATENNDVLDNSVPANLVSALC